MTLLDVPKEYQLVRDEHSLGPHNDNSTQDLVLFDFFTAGCIRGMNHALLSIQEKAADWELVHVDGA